MTRRTRRRLVVAAAVTAVGATVPLWLPSILATLPAFQVERVEVLGTRFVPPDEVVRLAAVDTAASVWDDPAPWEARVAAHPLVREVSVRRAGFRALEIQVTEERPVALAATPTLVPVTAEGRVLPLDPAVHGLDLPILRGRAAVEEGRLAEPHRRLAVLLGRLGDYDPGFVNKVSDLGPAPGESVEIHMLEPAAAGRILLPLEEALAALRRVELALGDAGVPALAADARFEDQVVLRFHGPTAAALSRERAAADAPRTPVSEDVTAGAPAHGTGDP